MLEFVLKYWIQFFFGIVSMSLTALCKYFYNLYKKEKSLQQLKFHEELKILVEDAQKITLSVIEKEKQTSEVADRELESQITAIKNEASVLKEGVLSINGRNFKTDCRSLLKADREISLDDYEQISHDHMVYNSLGGNDRGDSLFDLVTTKFEAGLAREKEKRDTN